jgi:hypothetical protein
MPRVWFGAMVLVPTLAVVIVGCMFSEGSTDGYQAQSTFQVVSTCSTDTDCINARVGLHCCATYSLRVVTVACQPQPCGLAASVEACTPGIPDAGSCPQGTSCLPVCSDVDSGASACLPLSVPCTGH